MATTPNYGWVTPAPTDFVTDLPADFETFADAVDADLAGLLGGTTGQVLIKDSNADHDFSWASPSGGGKIAQVVQGTSDTLASTTSTSYQNTNLSVTITPTLNTSKILLICSATGQARSGAANTTGGVYADFILANDTTQLGTVEQRHYFAKFTQAVDADIASSLNLIELDSPATTSAITYRLRHRVESSSPANSVVFTRGHQRLIALEVLA